MKKAINIFRKMLPGVWAGVLVLGLSFGAAGQGWVRFFDQFVPQKVVEKPNGGFWVAGLANDGVQFQVFSIDNSGQILGDSKFSPPCQIDRILDIVASPDSGYTILMACLNHAAFERKLQLCHINNLGVQVWQTEIPSSSIYSTEIAVLQDGYFCATGSRDSVFFHQIGFDGKLNWEKYIPTNFGNANSFAHYIKNSYLKNGHLIIEGVIETLADPTSANYLILSDTLGNVLWKQEYQSDTIVDLVGTSSDSTFWLSKSPFYIPNAPFFVEKRNLDNQGICSSPNLIYEKKVSACSDGGFAFLDFAFSSYYLQKVNSNCQFEWNSIIPYLKNDPIKQFSPTKNGGFLILAHPAGGLQKPKLIVIDSLGQIYNKAFSGKIFEDSDFDCVPDSLKIGIQDWNIVATNTDFGFNFYARTDSTGHFWMPADSGNYEIKITNPNPYRETCLGDTIATQLAVFDTVFLEIPYQTIANCPFLETDIGTWGLRRCQNNQYTVRFCNTGTTAALVQDEAHVEITLDPAMDFVSAGLPHTDLGNQKIRFELGAVPVNFCGSFPLTVFLHCDSVPLGATHCVEAHIFPDSFCLAAQNWTGANVEVGGGCHPDSVRFWIKNTGTAATSLLNFIVIEDNIIFRTGNFQLPPGDSLPVTVPANGSTWRLEAMQEPNNPGDPMPSVTVEGCGENTAGATSIGFVSQFGEADGDPFVSVDCRQNIGSFDPNDKQAAPEGYGLKHFIAENQPLEYLIRFQNTGTDTAFRVVVRDTLPPGLDPSSLVPGVSSHPFQFNLKGRGIAEWIFDPIFLPDSNVNEAASHGFLKFRILQKPDLPVGSRIENSAAIFFDFNPPVITNRTFHTVGKDFILVKLDEPVAGGALLKIYPNPAGQEITIEILEKTWKNASFRLFDGRGRTVFQQKLNGDKTVVGLPNLPAGFYFFEVLENGKFLGKGKLVKIR